MYTIAAEVVFHACHHLLLPQGHAEPSHQHAWRARATVEADNLDGCQLVMDFHLLERLLQQVVAPLTQHPSINDAPDFARINPSAERVARFMYDRLADLIPPPARLTKLTVWETDTCRATYRP